MARKRRKSAVAFSLFAFQDIITSVTGIVILITLLLAVELMERVENTPQSQVQTDQQTELIQETIAELESEKEKLNEQIASATIDTSNFPSTDLETLNNLQSELTKKSQALKTKIATSEQALETKKSQLSKIDSETKQKIPEQEKELQDLKKENLVAEQKLKEISSSDRVFFRNGVKDKTTWLVEASNSGFLVAEIGVSAPPATFPSNSQFKAWLQSLSVSKDAVYMLVKPGGSGRAEYAQDSLKSAGLDYGYGLSGASQKLIDSKSGAGS